MSNINKFNSNKKFTKSNYDEALKKIIPSLYFEQDYENKERELDILDQIINCNLRTISNIQNIIPIQAFVDSSYTNIDTPEGIAPYFIKQNNLTDIDTNDFERRILIPLEYSFNSFDTSSQFSDFINDILLPGTRLNNPTLEFVGAGSAVNHDYLINNLSWLYFLNLSGSFTYSPTEFIHDVLIEKIYSGGKIETVDAIKGLTTFIWKNYETCTAWQDYRLIPEDLCPPSLVGDTSGTQQLEKLLTLIEVLYSPLYMDSGDLRVANAISDYLENEFELEQKILNGPFIKLVKALSFAFADYSNSIDKLEILNDLDRCPDELLPYLADLIGWKLFGSEPDRWRLQLANAVDIYKVVGTKKSIQFVVDSVLGQDVFDASSTVSELWESYIPNLIYYALATESTLLENFTTWNPTIAARFGVTTHSSNSMDENIKLCVDQILYQLVLEYRSLFLFNGKPFEIGSSEFSFNYRGRIFQIPPFEEYPYYVNLKITRELIDSIVDKLVCFGVPLTFAIKVGNFIRENIFENESLLSVNNSWVFFTSSIQYPPNWAEVIKDITNTRSQYLPLWNGKSSYFKILLEVSGFDFSKNSLEADSKETLKVVAAAVKEFSPAHSIPDLLLLANEEDQYSNITKYESPYLKNSPIDSPQLIYTSSAGQSGFAASALVMATYKRGLTATSVNSFSRESVDEINDQLLLATATTANLPRKHHRRRNLKNIVSKSGFYDFTGDNQPIPMNPFAAGAFTYYTRPVLYLGLIPSSTWVPITDYNNIPEIYAFCEDLNSDNIYSGLVVSNTFPVRGWKSRFNTQPEKFLSFGELDPILQTIHYINETKKHLEASAYYYENKYEFDASSGWSNVIANRANTLTEFSGAFPNSFDDYVNVSFGRDFHKLYSEYTHNFSRHRTSPSILQYDGPTVIAHAFGSIIHNSEFKQKGSLTLQLPSIYNTSLTSVVELTNGLGIFSSSGTASGTYIANSLLDYGVGIKEYRNSGVLSHVELCQVSGTGSSNSFTIFNIDGGSLRSRTTRNSLLHDNVLIRQVSKSGFGRLIFDLSKYTLPSEVFDKSNNFLSPDHEFKFKIKTLISSEDGQTIGGGSIGVWIHTKPEMGKIWSYVNDAWTQHSASGISRDDVIGKYSNIYSIPQTTRQSQFTCARFIDPSNENYRNDVLASLSETEAEEIQLDFHTLNRPCAAPGEYPTMVPWDYAENISNNLHRLDQNYVIEVFLLPNQNDKFALLYGMNMMDMTLNKWSKPYVTNAGCQELRVDLTREQVLSVIKYFNMINGAYETAGYAGTNHLTGYASRVASETQSFYEANGGSRINYVENPDWNLNVKNSSYSLIESITIIN